MKTEGISADIHICVNRILVPNVDVAMRAVVYMSRVNIVCRRRGRLPGRRQPIPGRQIDVDANDGSPSLRGTEQAGNLSDECSHLIKKSDSKEVERRARWKVDGAVRICSSCRLSREPSPAVDSPPLPDLRAGDWSVTLLKNRNLCRTGDLCQDGTQRCKDDHCENPHCQFELFCRHLNARTWVSCRLPQERKIWCSSRQGLDFKAPRHFTPKVLLSQGSICT